MREDKNMAEDDVEEDLELDILDDLEED